MPSRLNNRKTGAMIVVMQRVHEGKQVRQEVREPNRSRFPAETLIRRASNSCRRIRRCTSDQCMVRHLSQAAIS
jgi:hypothetical protein